MIALERSLPLLYALDRICILVHTPNMSWQIEFHPDFDPEYDTYTSPVRDELLAQLRVLEDFGPRLGRPRVDTLKGSRHSSMKELRFQADDGVWRVAFAFDPDRKALVLAAGNKSGVSERRFYRTLIKKADERFDAHLDQRKYGRRSQRKR